MPKKDKKEEKIKRIAQELSYLEEGDIIAFSTLARNSGIHPHTLRDIFDMFDTMKDVGFRIQRDKNGTIIRIIKEDSSLDLRKSMREFEKKMIDLKNDLDEIKTILKKKNEK